DLLLHQLRRRCHLRADRSQDFGARGSMSPTEALGRQHWVAGLPWAAIFIVAVVVLLAVFPEGFAPNDPTRISIGDRLRPPLGFGGTSEHILGTDQLGRDVLSRVIFGAQISVAVGFLSVLGAGGIGTVLGLLAGYFRGMSDVVI